MVSNVDDLFISPSKDQLQKIKSEINEDEERSPHLENLLHTWMNCQPHFPKKYDKRITRSFLRNSKYNTDKAKTKLENNFTVRNLYPELFSGRSVSAEDVVQALDTVNMVFLPKLTENGQRISIYSLEDVDPDNFNASAICKLFFMTYDLILTSQHPVAGDVAIFDGAGISANHFVRQLTILKTITPILRGAYTMRLKEIHMINAPPLLDKILTVIKPILHHKVRNAFVNHNSEKSLCAYFGEDLLPSNYGGKCKSLRELTKDFQKILSDNQEWFFEQESVKITTMPKKIETNTYFKEFSIEGSFRSLQID